MKNKQCSLYVSLTGKDTWSGTSAQPNRSGTDGPFATLERARLAIRKMNAADRLPSGGVTVCIRGGTYYLHQTFTLSKRDAGTEQAPITYRAYRGETVVLCGGTPVLPFSLHRGKIMVADVPRSAYEVPGSGTDLMRPELFFNGARMELARWPNRDPDDMHGGKWAYIQSVPGKRPTRTRFRYLGDRPSRWANPGEAEVHVFPRYDWRDCIVRIKKIDTRSKEIQLAGKAAYPFEAGRRFYVRNVLEELDSPGEWYLDKKAGKLYFWPPERISDGDAVLSRLESIVSLKNASNVTLRGLQLECCQGVAAVLKGCTNSRIVGCIIRNTGGYGVIIEECTGSSVIGCDIHDTGRGGVILSGGDRKTLAPGRNLVENCHIHHYGRIIKCYQSGVHIQGVGNRIRHCSIHHAPHNAILLAGNEHVIEYNRVHHVALESADVGAFYMGRDWSMQGNIIRYNIWHDIYGYGCQHWDISKGTVGYEAPHGAWGVYLDDCASGTTVFGNIFYRVPMAALHVGGGRDNVIENNIIVGACPSLHLDARWDEYALWYTLQKERLEAVNYTKPPYSKRYPKLLKIYDVNPRLPMGNRIVRNIMVYRDDNFRGFWAAQTGKGIAVLWELEDFHAESTEIDNNLVWHHRKPVRVARNAFKEPGGVIGWREWKASGFDVHSVIADPRFRNPAKDDYRLKAGSPAFKLGFKPIPVEKIGPYKSPLRASWPIRESSEPILEGIVKKRVSLRKR